MMRLQLLVATALLPFVSTHALAHPTDPTAKSTWAYYTKLIDTVLALPPDDLRNLQISEAYSELSPLFQGLIHSGDGANWPTIATWASGWRQTQDPPKLYDMYQALAALEKPAEAARKRLDEMDPPGPSSQGDTWTKLRISRIYASRSR